MFGVFSALAFFKLSELYHNNSWLVNAQHGQSGEPFHPNMSSLLWKSSRPIFEGKGHGTKTSKWENNSLLMESHESVLYHLPSQDAAHLESVPTAKHGGTICAASSRITWKSTQHSMIFNAASPSKSSKPSIMWSSWRNFLATTASNGRGRSHTNDSSCVVNTSQWI